MPLYKQEAFAPLTDVRDLTVTEKLCDEVLSLPIHTEMKTEVQDYIIDAVKDFH